MEQERRKTMVGRVVSDKMEKTALVEVAIRTRHPLYGKVMTRARRFMAHNEEPLAKLGDTVKIIEARPRSNRKRWLVSEIVRRGEVLEMVRDVELESLLEKERAEKEARKEEERRRATERLARLAGEESMEADVEEKADEEVEEVEEAEESQEAE
jgi:small subunit ribosomal protein S17